ncbi:MAG TPA: helix-turn-helix domain-containing protein [Ktedonobacteraceae bacterium]|nr:helix-turn-helix domain-containing protein [Ktedonobacteraceae bacterium]
MRTRAQIILLAGEQRLRVSAIAPIVREVTQTVRNWLKHWMAEGIEGLKDRPMPGPPPKITEASKEQLLAAVRRRPRSLEQPYSMWTLQRLADSMAEQTGIRASIENVRLVLKAGEIVLSRPQHKVSSPDPEYLVKKDDRRRARRAKRGRRVLLCRRVQSQLVSHVARDVEPKRPASDDPHAQAAR